MPSCELFARVASLNLSFTDCDEYSDYADQVWTWDNDGTMFYLDVGEIVRFRVETEEWHDQIPNAPDLGEEIATERKPAYSIFVRRFSGSIISVDIS